jgi:hypothetical protein
MKTNEEIGSEKNFVRSGDVSVCVLCVSVCADFILTAGVFLNQESVQVFT